MMSNSTYGDFYPFPYPFPSLSVPDPFPNVVICEIRPVSPFPIRSRSVPAGSSTKTPCRAPLKAYSSYIAPELEPT